jgi:hypothetical protein
VDYSGYAVIYSEGKWGARVKIDTSGVSPLAVSCASPSFCVAVDNYGKAEIYNGTSWQAPETIATGGASAALYSVSCPSESFCVAVDFSGYAVTYKEGSWESPVEITSTGVSLFGVSCSSESFCAAVGGQLVIYENGSWGSPSSLAPGGRAVSCPSAGLCFALSQTDARIYSESSWGTPLFIDGNALRAVSCASAAVCVAVDEGGNALIYSASAKKAEEEAAAKKKAEEEAAKKRAEEEAAARKKAEEEAAVKKKAEEEAATKRKHEEEHAAIGNISLDGTRITVQHHHVALIRLTCTGTATCVGKLTLTVKARGGRGKVKNLGSVTVSIPAGKTETVRLNLSGIGRRLLSEAHGHLGCTLTILKSSPSPSNTQTVGVHLVRAHSRA